MSQSLVLQDGARRPKEARSPRVFTESRRRPDADRLLAAIILRVLLIVAATAFFAAVERGLL